jgi:hypothetical protein
MLSEIEQEDRAQLEKTLIRFIDQVRTVEDEYPYRATKRQWPSGVEVPKKDIEYYRGKMETLLRKLQKIVPFDIDDPDGQGEAYADFQKVRYWINHNMKYPWKSSRSRDAPHGKDGLF